jgi:hypothetical protein
MAISRARGRANLVEPAATRRPSVARRPGSASRRRNRRSLTSTTPAPSCRLTTSAAPEARRPPVSGELASTSLPARLQRGLRSAGRPRRRGVGQIERPAAVPLGRWDSRQTGQLEAPRSGSMAAGRSRARSPGPEGRLPFPGPQRPHLWRQDGAAARGGDESIREGPEPRPVGVTTVGQRFRSQWEKARTGLGDPQRPVRRDAEPARTSAEKGPLRGRSPPPASVAPGRQDRPRIQRRPTALWSRPRSADARWDDGEGARRPA